MSSERAALAAVALAACGGSVHDLSVASDPLLVIHGHVDRSALARQHPDVPLLGGLVWAGVPRISPLCLKFDNPDIRAACPDPYGVFYGEVERAAPVDDAGNFELPLYHLPKASVSIGDDVTRIAYGSLVVAEDVTGDGQLSFALPARYFGGREGRDQAPAPAGPAPESDVIVAASFHTLHADQRRVVFREGGFVADSNFYPAPGCPMPPSGFSVMSTTAYIDSMAASACTFATADATIEVPPVSGEEGVALMCRPVQRGFRTQDAQADERPPPDARQVCLSPEVLATLPSGPCPRLLGYTLKGCEQDPFCTAPEWDHTASPPPWWPCH